MKYVLFIGLLFAIILVSGCCCCTGSQVYTPTPTSNPTYNPTSYPTYTATPVPRSLATGTYITDKMHNGIGELDIENGLKDDAVIILVKTYDEKTPLLSVYVQAEDTFTATGIDDGVYYVYYMTGMDWDGNTKQFTDPSVYKRYNESFDFTNYDYEIGLKPIVGGTGKTAYVDEDDFPIL